MNNKKFIIAFAAIYLNCFCTFGQSADESWKLYDDSEVAVINITMGPSDLQQMLSNPFSDLLRLSSVHFKNEYIDETIDSVGIRIRGNTSRASRKKSFKLSFNDFKPGREFFGVEKMNLNGEHNDPSISRSKLCWDLFSEIGLTASSAAHAEVYINGDYYGLYISVEHIDNEFVQKNFDDDTGNLWKCLWPADLTFRGDNPDSYKFSQEGRRTYDLKTNIETDDYSKLARLVNIINISSLEEFADSLEEIFIVPEFLKYLAVNTLVGGWDSYWNLMNNYYLYHEPSTDKFHWIPYDYDNTFGVDWFSNDWAKQNPYTAFIIGNSTPRPLAEKLMNIPRYKDLYSHFLEFMVENSFGFGDMMSKISRLKTLISPSALNDNFRTLDYSFSYEDFQNSFEFNFNDSHVKYGLKSFVNERTQSLPNQISYENAPPIVYYTDYSPKYPEPNDTITVVCSVFGNAGLKNVSINYQLNELTVIQRQEMNHNPVEGTKLVEKADRWIGKIPPIGINSTVSFRIEVEDNNEQNMVYPRNKSIKLMTPSMLDNRIIINELLASNDSVNTDESGEYDDWVELYNTSDETLLLSGSFVTDDFSNLTKYRLMGSNLTIEPGEYLLLWCDNDTTQGGNHTNFRLDADGEEFAIVSSDSITIIDSVSFGPQTTDISYGRLPDGTGDWDFLMPTPLASNTITDIKDFQIPQNFDLFVYPNPFNPSTNIGYNLPTKADVKIVIYDLLGREIWRQEMYDQFQGSHNIVWDAKNNFGKKVSSGIYLARVNAGNFTKITKLMLLK